MIKLKKIVPLCVLLLIVLIVWQIDIYQYINFRTLKEYQQPLKEYVKYNYLTSIIIYSAIYVVITSTSLPIATIMSIIGGFLFGQVLGTGLVIISATIGGSITFLSAKVAAEGVMSKIKNVRLDNIKKGFKENAFTYIISLRLMPLIPFVVVNLISGLLNISLKSFFFGTLIGILPSSFIFVSIGNLTYSILEHEEISFSLMYTPQIILPFLGLVFLSFVSILFYVIRQRKIKNKVRLII